MVGRESQPWRLLDRYCWHTISWTHISLSLTRLCGQWWGCCQSRLNWYDWIRIVWIHIIPIRMESSEQIYWIKWMNPVNLSNESMVWFIPFRDESGKDLVVLPEPNCSSYNFVIKYFCNRKYLRLLIVRLTTYLHGATPSVNRLWAQSRWRFAPGLVVLIWRRSKNQDGFFIRFYERYRFLHQQDLQSDRSKLLTNRKSLLKGSRELERDFNVSRFLLPFRDHDSIERKSHSTLPIGYSRRESQ